MKRIEIILTDCIADIKSGKATLEECLERYPSLRKELELSLRLAVSIQKPDTLKFDNESRETVKARIFRQIEAGKPEKHRSFSDILSLGIPARFAWGRVAVSVVTVIIVLSILTGGTAYASQSSLPGDLLYPVKTTSEDVRLFMAGNEEDKIELNLEFAKRRLDEMNKLASVNEPGAAIAVRGYQAKLDALYSQVAAVSGTALNADLDMVLAEIQNQMDFCDTVTDKGPRYAGPVREASSLSIKTQLELLKIMEQQDITLAAQTNLNAMQNRLQRALNKAGEGQFRIMEEVLLQYQQFSGLGEEILGNARAENRDTSEIENLSIGALANYLNTIEDISQEAPQEYQTTIQTCRESTIQFQEQAHGGPRYRGGAEAGEGQPLQGESSTDSSPAGEENGQNTPQYQHQDGSGNSTGTQPNLAPTPTQGSGEGNGGYNGGSGSDSSGGSQGNGANGQNSGGGYGGTSGSGNHRENSGR